MVEGVIPSSGGSSSSSMALPRPAENLSVAEAVRETTLSKGSSKKRAATVKQAKTKLSVAETKLTELNALKCHYVTCSSVICVFSQLAV